ncbi:enoyl-CoA hydratase [Orrella marina]|uniref:Enoyl-CoA hydratase n=1 Tax=Orrella marina TaxID=2163011 RepID=A0A2R4XM29_9BURK|nr:enoyl-CoA hydratase [Orrella marina]AWB34853.1 enoyl-CoA hydratase [Orrella marina]
MSQWNRTEGELLQTLIDGVLILSLNRPKQHNALTLGMYAGLRDALVQANQSPDVRVVVLEGVGASFCSGGDVSRMASNATASAKEGASSDQATREADLRRRTEIVELLHQTSKPTIALLRGHVVGAGLSLALACDIRLGDATIRMMTGFARVGLSGDFGGHYFLPRIVGMARAREMYLLSRPVLGEQALELGLVTELVDAGILREHGLKLARDLADGPTFAYASIKANLNDGLDADLSRMLDLEAQRHVACVESADHKEAVTAFQQKRAPQFRNHTT